MKTLSYSSKKGEGDKSQDNIFIPLHRDLEERVLIVDDILGSGHTLSEIFKHYTEEGHKVSTAVLLARFKREFSASVVGEILPEDAGWVTFPWETSFT
jgi:hypoxanthine-guanine phosphoribosyltransferase